MSISMSKSIGSIGISMAISSIGIVANIVTERNRKRIVIIFIFVISIIANLLLNSLIVVVIVMMAADVPTSLGCRYEPQLSHSLMYYSCGCHGVSTLSMCIRSGIC